MASKPKRPCNYPGCPALSTEKFCPAHAGHDHRQDRALRGSSHHRGYTARWQQYRAWFLGKHPLCGDREASATIDAQLAGRTLPPAIDFSQCKDAGLVRAAVIVDHIFPVAGPPEASGDPLFWPSWNHQALCIACHNRKTAKERTQASP